MSVRFLLDTSIVSKSIGPRVNHAVVRSLENHSGEVAIASVVWHELRFGAERLPAGRRRDEILYYLDNIAVQLFPILPYDEAAATWHATERARLAAAGATPPFQDGQIAAVAAVNGLTLVTANMRDFERFNGLVVEDWSN